MTEEKYKEIKKKMLKAVHGKTPDEMMIRYQEIALDYVEMINEIITPMNELTTPLVVAALEYMKSTVLKTMNSEQREVAENTEMFLKLTARAEKVDIK